MRTDPYSLKTDRSNWRAGTVLAYYPDKSLYSVGIDTKGATLCKQLNTGIQAPIKEGARVVLVKPTGSDWIILGSIPESNPTLSEIASTESEYLAVTRGRVLNPESITFEPSFREKDSKGELADPLFGGDAQIHNNTDDIAARSFIQVHKFGDILNFASGFCFSLYSKARSTIITHTRNFYLTAIGYRKTVVTPVDGDNLNLTTVTEEYKADPTIVAPLVKKEGGYILDDTNVASQGLRTAFDNGLLELDTDSKTLRMVIGGVNVVIGAFDYELTENPVSGKQNTTVDVGASTSGLILTLGNSVVKVSGDEIIATTGDLQMTLSAGEAKVVSGSSVMTLTNGDITLDTDSFVVNSQTVDITASAGMTLTGATIDLNN